MIVLAQTGVGLIQPRIWISLFFALILYAIGAGASDFAQRQDARSVILMGGSLAGAQAVYPIGGLLTAFLVPGLVGLARIRGGPGRTGGLLALLLFAPCVAAIVFAYFANSLHFDGARLLAALAPSRSMLASSSPGIATLESACVLLGMLPAIGRIFVVRAAHTVSGLAICVVAAALTASLIVGTLVGVAFEPSALSVMTAPLCVLATSAWPATPQRAGAAFGVCTVSMMASWFVAIWTPLG